MIPGIDLHRIDGKGCGRKQQHKRQNNAFHGDNLIVGRYAIDPFPVRTEWQKLMDEESFKRFREERIVFHGLRKNAVINLLEVGCTENQVGSICNMAKVRLRAVPYPAIARGKDGGAKKYADNRPFLKPRMQLPASIKAASRRG